MSTFNCLSIVTHRIHKVWLEWQEEKNFLIRWYLFHWGGGGLKSVCALWLCTRVLVNDSPFCRKILVYKCQRVLNIVEVPDIFPDQLIEFAFPRSFAILLTFFSGKLK